MNPNQPHTLNGVTLRYQDAGVDINAGQALVERIKRVAQATTRPEVMGRLGGFGALCQLPAGYREPVLVAGTDGVGTKLKLAIDWGQHDGIGIDLVAMCVNDLLVCGAEPLFFLDYYATGKLDVAVAEQVVAGIGRGCQQAGCALVGGETAEMPGLYQGKDYDLAGFCVGVVEKTQIVDGAKVSPGDVLIGLTSSGPHANGYALIRKILALSKQDLQQSLSNGQSLAEILLAPTRIYVPSVLPVCREYPVHAMAHITGGGLTENLPRVLPAGCQAIIDRQRWQMPEIFQWLQQQGNIALPELFRTFNCGIGMVLCVPVAHADAIIARLQALGETAMTIGHITAGEGQPVVIH